MDHVGAHQFGAKKVTVRLARMKLRCAVAAFVACSLMPDAGDIDVVSNHVLVAKTVLRLGSDLPPTHCAGNCARNLSAG